MPRPKRAKQPPEPPQILEGATGAADASSGGGAGAGIPDAGTNMRTGGKLAKGDVEADRKKLFPEAKTKRFADPDKRK